MWLQVAVHSKKLPNPSRKGPSAHDQNGLTLLPGSFIKTPAFTIVRASLDR